MHVQDLCKFQRAFFGLDRICNEKICKFALICKLYLLAESSVIDLRKSNISYSYHFMNWSPVFNKPKVPCCVYSISCSSTENSKNMLVPRVFQSERYRTRARTLALSKSQSISVIDLKPMCLGQYLCCLHFATYYRNRSMYSTIYSFSTCRHASK